MSQRYSATAAIRSPTHTEPRSASSLFLEGPLAERVLLLSVCIAYFLRRSALPLGIDGYTYFIICASLIGALGLYAVLAGGYRVNGACMLMVALTAPSAFLAPEDSLSLPRWAGWVAVLAGVGPLFRGGTPCRIRRSLFKAGLLFSHACVVVSLAMLVTGLSLGGRGGFSGITGHSIFLSQLGAFATVDAFRRAGFSRHGNAWLLYSAAAGLLTLVAGSRAAIAGALCGLTLISYRRPRRWQFVLFVCLLGLSVVMLLLLGGSSDEELERGEQVHPWLSRIYMKGFTNSRTNLWLARWREFVENPLFGVGFQCTTVGSGQARSAGAPVEPGSSFLAVLSMTGLAGAIGVMILTADVLASARRNWRRVDPRTQELMVAFVGAFVFILLAEGSIFAVGEACCILFWSLAGIFGDLPESAKRLD